MAEKDNFVLSTCLDCCSASQKAYDGATIQTDLMHALVVDQPFSTILAFRGTKHAKDFLTDAEFIRTKIYPKDYREVHEGFWKAWLSVRESIIDFARTVPSHKPFYVTGHSLGGATANICCWELASLGIPFFQCYTFGEPRLGNKAFVKDCELKFGGIKYRMVNNLDIVPRSPALFTGYRHTKRNIYISEDGSLYFNPPFPIRIALDIMAIGYDFKKGQFGLLKDHYIVDYYNHLKLKFRA